MSLWVFIYRIVGTPLWLLAFLGGTRDVLAFAGDVDTTFDPAPGLGAVSVSVVMNITNTSPGTVYSIALQGDGKILLGGIFNTVNGTRQNRICRLNRDGSPDKAFNASVDTSGAVRSIVVQPDGSLLLGGLQRLMASAVSSSSRMGRFC